MTLPIIDHPLFDEIIPSSKKKIKMRPMLVKEEKLLLMAKKAATNTDIYQSIKQVLTNCIQAADLATINRLTLFDLEFLFLKLRSISVSHIVKVTYKDGEDQKDYDFEVNLNKIQVRFHEDYKPVIATGQDAGFTMKYPTADIYSAPVFANPEASETDLIQELIIHCIDSYFNGEKVYKFGGEPREKVLEFIDNLDINTYNRLRDHITHLPSLSYKITYKNSLDHERTIEMSTLSDFFTL